MLKCPAIVVSLTPRPLHPQGNSRGYPLHRKLGGPQMCVEEVFRSIKSSRCTKILTDFMERSPYWEGSGHSDGEEIHRLLWNPVTYLVQDRDQWRSLMNIVVNLRVP